MCQPSRFSPKGVETRDGVPVKTLGSKGVDLGAVLHRLEEARWPQRGVS